MPWLGDGEEQGFLPNSIVDIINQKEGNERLEKEILKKDCSVVQNPVIKNPVSHRMQCAIYEGGLKSVKKQNRKQNTRNNYVSNTISYKKRNESFAQAYINQGINEQSINIKIQCLEKALQFSKNKQEREKIYQYLGDAYSSAKEYVYAHKNYISALQINPGNAELFIKISYCCINRKFYNLAKENYLKAQKKLGADHPEIKTLLQELKKYINK